MSEHKRKPAMATEKIGRITKQEQSRYQVIREQLEDHNRRCASHNHIDIPSLEEWVRRLREFNKARKPSKTTPSKITPEKATPRMVTCPACDTVQVDGGCRTTCERCGLQPIPSYHYSRSSVFYPTSPPPRVTPPLPSILRGE